MENDRTWIKDQQFLPRFGSIVCRHSGMPNNIGLRLCFLLSASTYLQLLFDGFSLLSALEFNQWLDPLSFTEKRRRASREEKNARRIFVGTDGKKAIVFRIVYYLDRLQWVNGNLPSLPGFRDALHRIRDMIRFPGFGFTAVFVNTKSFAKKVDEQMRDICCKA